MNATPPPHPAEPADPTGADVGQPDPEPVPSPLDLATYQRLASRTGGAIAVDHPIVYPTLGLANEAGEVAGKVKKIFRDRDGVITDADREALKLEMGDVLWYLAELCTRLDISLEDVAAANVAKLRDRRARGTLHGDGDYR
ncbi:MAG: nucleoside triphosphate pyrophosphohydrolase family protein [Actinomycetota bacterium]